jgi:shikimate dehydrogenase
LKITGTTQIVGVFGYPVRHTLSPEMHNVAFEALGLNFCYVPFEVHPDRVGEALQGVRALGISGVNITIPHKQAVLPYLDEITPRAALIGAVNTIRHARGCLLGDNTDAEGFLRPLRDAVKKLQGRRAVLVGAGGAARAVAFSLASEGVSFLIVNKTLSRAEGLAEDIARAYGKGIVRSSALNDASTLQESLASADMLINATSIGMHPHYEVPPVIPQELLHPDLLVYDLVYNPVETSLLQAARNAGCRVIEGLEMFVWQGAIAFEWWTKHPAPVEVMRDVVAKRLRR